MAQTKTAQGWEPVASAGGWEPVDVPAGPDLSAPANNTEGLYEMSGPGGVKQVPFSKVKDALGAGYSMKHPLLMKYRDDLRATRPKWYDAGEGNGPGEFGKGGASAIINTILHPLQSGAAMAVPLMASGVTPEGYPMYAPSLNPATTKSNDQMQAQAQEEMRQQGQFAREHPSYTAGGIIIPAALTLGMEKGLKAAPGILRSSVEGATGTGPKVTAELVADTVKKNQASAAKYGDALLEHQEKVRATRGENVKSLTEHINKVDEIAKDKKAGHAIIDAREGLTQSIGDAEKEVDLRTEKARHDALAEGNSKYNAVNPKLDPLEADPETMAEALDNSLETIKGSNTKPPILEDIRKRIQNGTDALTYRDLQGYYSELGNEISKGRLPGDVYHSLDKLHETIGKEMQRIADSKGMGQQLTDARAFWKRMKQTFGDTSDAVSDRAAKEVGKAAPELTEAQLREYRQRLLGSFDPEIPNLIQQIEKGKKSLESLPSETEARKLAAQQYPEPPTPKKAPPEPTLTTKKISPEDVTAAKEKSLGDTLKRMRQRGTSIAIYVTGYRSLAILGRALSGDATALKQIPSAVAEGIATVGGTNALANLLESPHIRELLTRPTARDIAQIPPELRSGLFPVIQAAERHGIKVSPMLVAAIEGPVVQEGPQTKRLRELRDKLHTQP